MNKLLLVHNKFPQIQQLRRIKIYYLTVSIDQEYGHELARSSKSRIRCQPGIQSLLRLGAFIQGHSGFGRIHSLAAVVFSSPLFCRLQAKNFSQLLEPGLRSQTCNSLTTKQITSSKPTGESLSLRRTSPSVKDLSDQVRSSQVSLPFN